MFNNSRIQIFIKTWQCYKLVNNTFGVHFCQEVWGDTNDSNKDTVPSTRKIRAMSEALYTCSGMFFLFNIIFVAQRFLSPIHVNKIFCE